MEISPHFPESATQWLTSPLGVALLSQESRVVEEALDGIFGEQCLQLGLWGDDKTFLRYARTQRTAIIDAAPFAGGPSLIGPSAIGDLHRLPIANDCIDCVLLPHTGFRRSAPRDFARSTPRAAIRRLPDCARL